MGSDDGFETMDLHTGVAKLPKPIARYNEDSSMKTFFLPFEIATTCVPPVYSLRRASFKFLNTSIYWQYSFFEWIIAMKSWLVQV